MADVTTARPGPELRPKLGTGRRERVRADGASGTYRTFPARLPAMLTALAGGFLMLGSLGTGVRASALVEARDDPRQVRALMGFRQGIGWILFVLGLAMLVASLAWLGRRRTLKLGAFALATATGALVVTRLLALDDRARTWAEAARRTPRYIGFHAGFGWGAWLLLAGLIIAGFGVLVGVLREIDLRKGIEG